MDLFIELIFNSSCSSKHSSFRFNTTSYSFPVAQALHRCQLRQIGVD